MPSEQATIDRLARSRAKALRALRLYERGHDLESISRMCNIPTGSIQKRIDLGRRLKEAGIK